MNKLTKKYHATKRFFYPSPAEYKFMKTMGWWYFIRYTIKREHKVRGYYIDFAIPTKMIAIEIDGRGFHGGTNDILRDHVLYQAGWNVLRIEAGSLWKEPKKVRRQVYAFTKSPRAWLKKYGKISV